jgi:TolA-binding protein
MPRESYSCLERAAVLLGAAVLTACAAPAPPPVVNTVSAPAAVSAPSEPARPAPAPASPEPSPTPLAAVLAYADRLRSLPSPELAQEITRLNDSAAAPERQMQLALALLQTRVPADGQRAHGLLQRVAGHDTPEARPLHPLARLLAAQWSEQRRVEEQLERQAQQLRDGQRRIDQLNDRLQALRAMERSLPSRPTP